MTDSTHYKEFNDWKLAHPYIFQWAMVDGKVMVLSAIAKLPDKIRAERLRKTFKRRGVSASRTWEVLSIPACSIDIFLGALTATGFTWATFETWVSFMHFDGSKYITDVEPVIYQDNGPHLPIFFCRWHNDLKGHLEIDQQVEAINPKEAARKFWETNRRNHPLPRLVDVVAENLAYQETFRLEEVVVRSFVISTLNKASPVDKSPFPVDKRQNSVDKPVRKLGVSC